MNKYKDEQYITFYCIYCMLTFTVLEEINIALYHRRIAVILICVYVCSNSLNIVEDKKQKQKKSGTYVHP